MSEASKLLAEINLKDAAISAMTAGMLMSAPVNAQMLHGNVEMDVDQSPSAQVMQAVVDKYPCHFIDDNDFERFMQFKSIHARRDLIRDKIQHSGDQRWWYLEKVSKKFGFI